MNKPKTAYDIQGYLCQGYETVFIAFAIADMHPHSLRIYLANLKT
ncbi:hypothetical protein SCALIN_C34_0096 [Candidatus Scalindua japonica]|uniref:Uncharacterized protein n=1 Tax=Candidatus Scalindua japonica TaxID=1284222 RepID=A0A286U345_9BACT|nr:hypothetical protein SCALIN_C34_0096 [Candidatus Scalindua japonica]